MSKTIQHIKTIIISLLSVLMLFSCQPDWTGGLEPDLNYANSSFPDRLANEETRRVLLLYSAGFNSLSSYLKKDIEDLQKGWLPSDRRTENVVLVYSHFPASGGGYKTPTSPTLVRLYRDRNSEIQADTLVVYPEGTISSSAKQLNKVLTYVKDNFKAKSYGMLFSSHATGYLPAGYYQNSLNAYKTTTWKAMGYQELTGVPYVEPEYDPSLPMVKSIGQDQVGSVGSYTSYEIELTDFVKAIPMELDYIMFDTCLMGGIEVAYELKSKVHRVGFSQTEVLAEGFCYETLVSHLLQGSEADPQSVCEDYFKQYEIQSGVYRSATISLILSPRPAKSSFQTIRARSNPSTIRACSDSTGPTSIGSTTSKAFFSMPA